MSSSSNGLGIAGTVSQIRKDNYKDRLMGRSSDRTYTSGASPVTPSTAMSLDDVEELKNYIADTPDVANIRTTLFPQMSQTPSQYGSQTQKLNGAKNIDDATFMEGIFQSVIQAEANARQGGMKIAGRQDVMKFAVAQTLTMIQAMVVHPLNRSLKYKQNKIVRLERYSERLKEYQHRRPQQQQQVRYGLGASNPALAPLFRLNSIYYNSREYV